MTPMKVSFVAVSSYITNLPPKNQSVCLFNLSASSAFVC